MKVLFRFSLNQKSCFAVVIIRQQKRETKRKGEGERKRETTVCYERIE